MAANTGKKIGVVLSEYSIKDGSEIHEAILTLLALDKRGIKYFCFAPRDDIQEVMNHETGKPSDEKRTIAAEASRISRSPALPLSKALPAELDALIFPNGFGAAKNLCDYGINGISGTVHPEVKTAVEAFHAAKKPMGFICIAPVIAAMTLGKFGIELTIGNDAATAADIEKTGAKHVACSVSEAHTDVNHKIVSTPTYMLDPSIAHIEKGINALIEKLLSIA